MADVISFAPARTASDGTDADSNAISLLFLGVQTGLLAALGAVTWFAADDYCNWMQVDQRGVWGALRWLYFDCSGRLLTGLAMYHTLASVDLPDLRWLSALSGACLLAVALL